jgi:hypothetical protein
MSNTLIQIKRSQTSATPASLNIAEPAYSFNSDKLFIGGPAGEILPIGGGYYVNAAINAYNTANNTLTSDFNVTPYYDDYTIDSNYYRSCTTFSFNLITNSISIIIRILNAI